MEILREPLEQFAVRVSHDDLLHRRVRVTAGEFAARIGIAFANERRDGCVTTAVHRPGSIARSSDPSVVVASPRSRLHRVAAVPAAWRSSAADGVLPRRRRAAAPAAPRRAVRPCARPIAAPPDVAVAACSDSSTCSRSGRSSDTRRSGAPSGRLACTARASSASAALVPTKSAVAARAAGACCHGQLDRVHERARAAIDRRVALQVRDVAADALRAAPRPRVLRRSISSVSIARRDAAARPSRCSAPPSDRSISGTVVCRYRR